jgi:hypothetical protein
MVKRNPTIPPGVPLVAWVVNDKRRLPPEEVRVTAMDVISIQVVEAVERAVEEVACAEAGVISCQLP